MSSFAILGTGAVGGYYGGMLQKSGQDVHFLVRSDYAVLKKLGLRVDSINGNFHLQSVQAYASVDAMPRCDVVIVSWKTTENKMLSQILPKVVKPGGVVLVLQNGLDPERQAAPFAGEAKIISGLCFLCAKKEGPGWIRHLDYGAITLAAFNQELSGPMGITPEMLRVSRALQAAGIETNLQEDWWQARWRKLVWNVPFNGLCALHGRTTSELLGEPSLRALAKALMLEVVSGAKSCGVTLPENFVDRMLEATDAMAPYEPSMKLDRQAGRPMELEAIYGRTVQEIVRTGGQAPLIDTLWTQLHSLVN